MWKKLIAMGLMMAPPLWADSATLSWTNPTQYTDGTPLDQAIVKTTLRCVAVVIGTVRTICPLADQTVIGAGTSYLWTYTVTTYSSGQVCFTAQTTITDGSMSDFSNEVCKAFSATRKVKPPTLVVK